MTQGEFVAACVGELAARTSAERWLTVLGQMGRVAVLDGLFCGARSSRLVAAEVAATTRMTRSDGGDIRTAGAYVEPEISIGTNNAGILSRIPDGVQVSTGLP